MKFTEDILDRIISSVSSRPKGNSLAVSGLLIGSKNQQGLHRHKTLILTVPRKYNRLLPNQSESLPKFHDNPSATFASRLPTIDMGQKLGDSLPFWGRGELGPQI